MGTNLFKIGRISRSVDSETTWVLALPAPSAVSMNLPVSGPKEMISSTGADVDTLSFTTATIARACSIVGISTGGGGGTKVSSFSGSGFHGSGGGILLIYPGSPGLIPPIGRIFPSSTFYSYIPGPGIGAPGTCSAPVASAPTVSPPPAMPSGSIPPGLGTPGAPGIAWVGALVLEAMIFCMTS